MARRTLGGRCPFRAKTYWQKAAGGRGPGTMEASGAVVAHGAAGAGTGASAELLRQFPAGLHFRCIDDSLASRHPGDPPCRPRGCREGFRVGKTDLRLVVRCPDRICWSSTSPAGASQWPATQTADGHTERGFQGVDVPDGMFQKCPGSTTPHISFTSLAVGYTINWSRVPAYLSHWNGGKV